MKHLTSLFMTLILITISVASSADETTYKSGNYKYSLDEYGNATIDACFESDLKISIPEYLDEHVVQAISEYAFLLRMNTISITIPDTVTSIDDGAFANCHELTSISVSPDHPVFAVIDNVLFDKREKKLLCYPSGNTSSSYSIPDGITSIGNKAFWGASSLSSLTIPDSVTSIGTEAFYYCEGLTDFIIPDTVTSIGDGAFSHICFNSISVSPDHPVFAVIDNVLFDKREKKLLCYPSGNTLSSYIIPDGITSIGDNAFWGASSLSSLTIPDSVTSIGDNAFRWCDNLTLTVGRNSYAREYAIENSIPYTYPDANDWLNN